MPMSAETHRALGLEAPAPLAVNGQDRSIFLTSLNHAGDAPYHPCPEAYPAQDTPRGDVSSHRDWDGSRIFADTLRDVRIYTPHGLDRSRPARLVIFHDGAWYMARDGAVRATQVLDTLHARGEIAPTVAVFVNPGRPRGEPDPAAADAQRSFEYDSMTPDHGRFLLEELLPFVADAEGLTFSDDPAHCTVAGISSGGICAFTVAWERPDSFRKMVSHIGSFTNIRGGYGYPPAIRKTKLENSGEIYNTPELKKLLESRRKIRVFLQDGRNDLDNQFGNWPLANQEMAAALKFAGWDYDFKFGEGTHNPKHGASIFPDTMRWLWRAKTPNGSG